MKALKASISDKEWGELLETQLKAANSRREEVEKELCQVKASIPKVAMKRVSLRGMGSTLSYAGATKDLDAMAVHVAILQWRGNQRESLKREKERRHEDEMADLRLKLERNRVSLSGMQHALDASIKKHAAVEASLESIKALNQDEYFTKKDQEAAPNTLSCPVLPCPALFPYP